jgi:hypothetical protein
MTTSTLRVHAAWALILVGITELVCAPQLLAQRAPARRQTATTTIRPTASASVTLVAAFRDALAEQGVRDAARAELVRQLGAVRPVAIVRGHWVTPIDMGRVYGNAAVRTAMAGRLGGDARVGEMLADPAASLGLVFTPGQFADALLGDLEGNLTASLGAEALTTRMTDLSPLGELVGGVVVDNNVLVGSARNAMGWLKSLYDWATGPDGVNDPNTGLPLDDPNADPDGDGTPNRLDSDDDGDGSQDSEDSHPYDDDASICDCGREGTTTVVFTNTNSVQVITAVLDAYRFLAENQQGTLSLGPAVAGGPALGVLAWSPTR